jgi:hypothetical protein
MTEWKIPVEPRFTQLFVAEIQEENRQRGKKPQAYNTPFRYSDSGKCARYLAYSTLGYVGDEFDMPSTFVTTLGTNIHELVQGAIGREYPEAMFEIPTQVVTSSGHSDGVIPTQDLGLVQYELKTMGGTAYKRSIGLNNRGLTAPAGPRYSAVLQAALNAKANDCDTIIIGHLALEAVSRQVAERVGLSEAQRFISEWVIPKEVWEPLADNEVSRQLFVLEELEDGYLPERVAIDDEGDEITLDPDNARFWQCHYCSMKSHCENDGPGRVAVTIKEGK